LGTTKNNADLSNDGSIKSYNNSNHEESLDSSNISFNTSISVDNSNNVPNTTVPDQSEKVLQAGGTLSRSGEKS